MAEAARGIAKFDHAEATVAAVDAQESYALHTELGVDVSRERQTLYAVILQDGEVPGYVCFGDRGIGGRGVDDRDLGLEGDTQSDVRGLGADGAKDCPILIAVDHLHGFVGRGATEIWISWAVGFGVGLRLLVVVVVVV